MQHNHYKKVGHNPRSSVNIDFRETNKLEEGYVPRQLYTIRIATKMVRTTKVLLYPLTEVLARFGES